MSSVWVKWAGFAAGAVLWLVTTHSVVTALVIPRGRTSLLSRGVGFGVVRLFLSVARRYRSYQDRDRVLAQAPPLALLTMLAVWLLLYVVAYALLIWPTIPDANDFGDSLRESVSSLFTLGFAAEPSAVPTVLHAMAAATGLVVVALQIAYLPTMYAAFSRRETAVTMLETRGGSPPWGPEILSRHLQIHSLDALPDLYGRWEEWSADVLESHLTYPMLVHFRSPHALSSWVLGLLAVLDSAAMYHALAPGRAPSEARLVLRMGYVTFNEIAQSLRLGHVTEPYPGDPVQLTFEEFSAGCGRVFEAGFPAERGIREAWEHFRGWRVNYETAAYALADLTQAAPGPWSGPRTHLPDQMIIPRRPATHEPGEERLR